MLPKKKTSKVDLHIDLKMSTQEGLPTHFFSVIKTKVILYQDIIYRNSVKRDNFEI